MLLANAAQGATLMDGAAHPPESHMSWSGVGYVTTGDDGTFTFSPIEGGYHLAAVHDSGYAQVSAEDLKKSPKIQLRPWGRIEGRVHPSIRLDPDDRILVWSNDEAAGFRESINASYQNIKVGPDRKFIVERVTPGLMRVDLSRTENMRSRHLIEKYVSVQEAKTTEVDLGGAGVTVVGKFLYPEDTPRRPGLVIDTNTLSLSAVGPYTPVPVSLLLKEDYEAQRAWTREWWQRGEGAAYRESHVHRSPELKEDGAFRADGVPPGEYDLSARLVLQGGRPGEVVAAVFKRVTVPKANGQDTVDLGEITLSKLSRPQAGDLAPPIIGKTFDGKPFFLEDLRGKTVVLNFWKSDDQASLRQLRRLTELAEAYEKNGSLAIVNLSLDADVEAAKKVAAEAKQTWTQVTLGDWGSTPFPANYGVDHFPATVIIGPDGKVLSNNPRAANLQAEVAKFLK